MLVAGHLAVLQEVGLNFNVAVSGGPEDVAQWVVPMKFEILEVGVRPRSDISDAPRVKFDIQLANGGARGDGDAGDVTCTANTGGQITYDVAASGVIVDMGDQIVAQLITNSNAAALTADVYVVGRWLAEVNANEADKIETA